MSRFLTRRGFLWGSVGTLGVIAGLGAGSMFACNRRMADGGPQIDPDEAARRLAAALDEVFAPERLAAHWPGTDRPDALLTAVQERPRLRAALDAACPATCRALVRAEIAADFGAGDICVTDRLVVSRTECLIACLCLAPATRAI